VAVIAPKTTGMDLGRGLAPPPEKNSNYNNILFNRHLYSPRMVVIKKTNKQKKQVQPITTYYF